MKAKMTNITIEKSKFVLTPITPQNFRHGTSLREGFSAGKNISRKTIVILLTAMAILSGVFISNVQSAPKAVADPISSLICDHYKNTYAANGWGTTSQSPEVSLSGIFGLATDALSGNNKITAYEKYGTSGTVYTYWYSSTADGVANPQTVNYINYNNGSPYGMTAPVPQSSPYWAASVIDCLGATGGIETGVANFMLGFSKFGVSVINTTYMVAFYGSTVVFNGFFDIIDGIVANFRTSLYLPFLSLLIMIGALWMGYQGLVKRRTTEAFNGALWMIGSVVAGSMLLVNPAIVPQTADFIVNNITTAIGTTITDGASQSVNSVLCSVQNSKTITDTSTTNPSTGAAQSTTYTVTAAARRTECAIWYNLVYTPWVVGQFGVAPGDTTAQGQEILYGTDATSKALKAGLTVTMGDNNKPLTNDQKSWPLVQLNAQSENIDLANLNISDKALYVQSADAALAYHELAQDNNFTWTGKVGFQRVTIASASIFATASTGLLVLIFGFMMLGYEITMLLLMILMPFFLLVGVHPGTGRRIALRWLELIVNVTIKRIMVSVMLSVFLLLYSLVMGSGIWLIQNILILAITIVGLGYIGKLMNIFGSVEFGGEKSINIGAGDRKNGNGNGAAGFRKVLGLAAGAAVGAASAAVGAGALSTTIGSATASVVGGSVAPPAPAPAGATGGAGASSAPAGLEGAGVPIVPATPASPLPSVAPSGDAAQKIAEQTRRVNDLKKQAIRQGAMQGAAQGFSTGSASGAVLGAAMIGLQTGDAIHDNEVQRIENQKRDEREAEMAASSQRQADVIARQLDAEEARNNAARAQAETASAAQRARDEWNARSKTPNSRTAAYDNYDGSLPPRPSVENRKIRDESDYSELEAAEIEKRRQAKGKGTLPPRADR